MPARGDKPAYIDDLGNADLRRTRSARARGGGGVHRAAALRREERVLLCLQDTVDFPVAFLGALYAGVVPVAVNTLLTADDYAFMLAHSRAQALLVSGALLPTLQQALARGGHDVKHVIVSRAVPSAAATPETALDFARWRERAAAAWRCPRTPAPTTWRSGSIRPARRDGRRVRCTRTRTCIGPASFTARPSWA